MTDTVLASDADYVCSFDEETLEKARRELHEDPQQRMGAVQTLRDWLVQQPHIKFRTDTMQLLLFLRGAKFSQLKARKMIESTLTMAAKVPQWFQKLDPKEPKILRLINAGYVLPLPKKHPSGCTIFLMRGGALNSIETKDMSLTDEIRTNLLVTQYCYATDEAIQVHGLMFFLDFTGLTMKHASKWGVEDIRNWINCWQGSFPGRYKQMNYYNMHPVLDSLFSLMKSMLNNKLKERIVIHGSNLESVYKNIPMECLPDDYLPDDYEGPSAGPLSDIIADFREKITAPAYREARLQETDGRYGIDLSKKPAETEPQASFRKLNLD